MKLLLAIILIVILSVIAERFFPWWTIAICAFVVSLAMGLKPGKGLLAGCLGIAIFWLTTALMKDIPNDHILSRKMSALIFHSQNYPLLIVLTVIIGSLTGGLAGWSGALLGYRDKK